MPSLISCNALVKLELVEVALFVRLPSYRLLFSFLKIKKHMNIYSYVSFYEMWIFLSSVFDEIF